MNVPSGISKKYVIEDCTVPHRSSMDPIRTHVPLTVVFKFLVIKTLDSDADPEMASDPDSLEMPDPDPSGFSSNRLQINFVSDLSWHGSGYWIHPAGTARGQSEEEYQHRDNIQGQCGQDHSVR
jgi:hypothetical protein